MADTKLALPAFTKGLSARLLILTIFFVMLSEVAVFAPSIGRFRERYLEERIATAHLATLALEATPDHMISEELAKRLLEHAGAYGIVLMGPAMLKRVIYHEMPPQADLVVDLRAGTFLGLIADAFVTLAQRENRVLRVVGFSTMGTGPMLEIIIDETPMRLAMYGYSSRILALSIAIAVATATLVFLSLQWLMVRPMRRLTETMISFRENPDDASRVIMPSGRSDEIGMAEQELAVMQRGLRAALTQRARLAALGTAVTKISHDLRNILATASLLSDRLATIDDPEVKRVSPTLVSTIDRAVNLCTQTLAYARDEPPPPGRSRFALRELIADVSADQSPADGGELAWENDVGRDLEVEADRDQLFRVLVNLGRNAREAGASVMRVSAGLDDGCVSVRVGDDGPGLPEKAREHLFEPFVGSTRPGGTGLGLAIAREIMRAHGGDISLVDSSGDGTVFRLDLPVGPLRG